MYFSFGNNGSNARILFKMDPRRDRLGQRPIHHDVGDAICPNMGMLIIIHTGILHRNYDT